MGLFKRNEKAEKIRSYKRVFESDDGKIVLKDLMSTFYIFNSTMEKDLNEMAYKEGSRSVVLRIMRTLQIDANELEKMLNEQDKK